MEAGDFRTFFLLFYQKVKEIYNASKVGELYSTLPVAVNSSLNVKAEPSATDNDSFLPASKVNTVSTN